MKSAIFAAGALLATCTLAAPGTAARWANHAARRAGRTSGFKLPAEDDGVYAKVNGTAKNVEYSSNWAGAVLSSSGYTSVVGTIVVPKPISSGRSSSSASAWVGIDGEYASPLTLTPSLSFLVLVNILPPTPPIPQTPEYSPWMVLAHAGIRTAPAALPSYRPGWTSPSRPPAPSPTTLGTSGIQTTPTTLRVSA